MSDQALFYVYILASHKNGTLYTGVTNNIARRIVEHREGGADGFTSSNNVKRLVYMEPYDSIELAIAREKSVKRWRRKWKIELIEKGNPSWRDLFYEINQ